MNRLFNAANQFLKEADWTTLAVFKFCLLSLGILIGVLLPQSAKPIIIVLCTLVFFATYIPLMAKLLRILKKKSSSACVMRRHFPLSLILFTIVHHQTPQALLSIFVLLEKRRQAAAVFQRMPQNVKRAACPRLFFPIPRRLVLNQKRNCVILN